MNKNLKQLGKNFSRIFTKWYYLFAFLSLLLWTGCTLIGLGIGSIIDSSKKKEKTIDGWQIQTIESGKDITLLLKNSDTIRGKFKGRYHYSEAEVVAAYEVQKQQLPVGVILPSIDDTVSVTLRSKNPDTPLKEFKYLFAGFDSKSLMVREGKNATKGHLPFSIVEKMTDKQGNITTGSKVSELVGSVIIPLKSLILIETRDSLRKIVKDDIQQVSIKPKKGKAALTGLLIGLGIDVIIVVTIVVTFISALRKAKFCPYVYSFDGHEYILDSETFSGAIFKAAQRTDWDNLDYLKESNGSYRMKLTNELEETQYIDEFKLMVVDHPIGSKLMPGFIGELHTLNDLHPPIKAIDQNGNNVLDLVKAKDQNIWISNPFTRNPEKKNDGRDAMILEFKKPKDATKVKLVFNIQNTNWAASMHGHMLSLHGNKLKDWYALMNSSQIAQSTFKQVMIREEMLLIQLWDGNSWKIKDYVWEVGPRIAKDLVVKLDLGNYSEENLRIRLESTVGFWMINSLEADYSDDEPISVTELSATKATDQSGNDLLEVLKNNDECYYIQPTQQNWAEIKFKAIPIVKNTIRSFILKCNGYYTSHEDETGELQQELLNKLSSEPGAYGQYSLRLLNQNIANSFHNPNLE